MSDNHSTSNRNCTVFGCTNTEKKAKAAGKQLTFYSYPGRQWETDRRQAWINFAKRKNLDGTPWMPSKYSRICSDHFLGGKKSDHPKHPNFNPTIRMGHTPSKGTSNKLARFDRANRRSVSNLSSSAPKDTGSTIPSNEVDNDHRSSILNVQIDKSTQVRPEMISLVLDPHMYTRNLSRTPKFLGFESLRHNGSALKDLTGVSKAVFDVLLNVLPPGHPKSTAFCNEDKLLMTLMKLKTGNALTFTALGVLFNTSHTTAANTFHTIIECIYIATQTWVFFPSKEAVCATMPEAFKTEYKNCRVIIDCFEVRTETPGGVAERIHMYSNYKGCFTVKFLIGITPSGFISFLSKAYGGRATDCFITNDCGILDLLEPGDTVMADKGFPHVNVQDDVIVVMPPFSKGKSHQFSSEEVDQTYQIASLRIHVERAIERIKQFNVLSTTIPIPLLPTIDEIAHVCCVIANLSTPIIKS